VREVIAVLCVIAGVLIMAALALWPIFMDRKKGDRK